MSGSAHSWSSFLALLSLVKSLLSNRPKVLQFDICPTLTIDHAADSDDDENLIKEEEEDNIVLLLAMVELKMFPRQEAKSIYSTVSHPWPPCLPHNHPPTRLAGRSAKRQPPPSPAKIAHSRQRLKEASAEPKHDLFRATWLDQIVAV